MIILIKNYLDQACEYKETEEFKMIKSGDEYKFGFNYGGYSVTDCIITVKEAFQRCINSDISKTGTIIKELIREKAHNKLLNKL